jgi:hypothetical protein
MSQNLTVRLESGTIRKAKILAARRSTSVSQLVAAEIDRLVHEDEAYERAMAEALAELGVGFDLGSEGHLPARADSYDR